MENTLPDELAYANAALVLALILDRDDFDNVLTAAISKLQPLQSISFKSGAIKFIQSLLPELRGSSA